MENTVFIITHVTMAICCLVIIIAGVRINKKEINQTTIAKRPFVDKYCADVVNDSTNEKDVIIKTDLRLIAN